MPSFARHSSVPSDSLGDFDCAKFRSQTNSENK